MEFIEYKNLVNALPIGKKLSDAVYLHKETLSNVSIALKDECSRLENEHAKEFSWDVVKFFRRDHKISFLAYPDFFTESYPVLHASLTIDIDRSSARTVSYTHLTLPTTPYV